MTEGGALLLSLAQRTLDGLLEAGPYALVALGLTLGFGTLRRVNLAYGAGAMLGALVMQSLQSGMILLGVDAPLQNIVVGLVLVLAVWVDGVYRSRIK